MFKMMSSERWGGNPFSYTEFESVCIHHSPGIPVPINSNAAIYILMNSSEVPTDYRKERKRMREEKALSIEMQISYTNTSQGA